MVKGIEQMQTSQQVLEDEFLEVRCMLIEIAAMLDRYDRASSGDAESAPVDPRLEKIYQSLVTLTHRDANDRSEQLLNLFTEY
jgi:hypothetical protein